MPNGGDDDMNYVRMEDRIDEELLKARRIFISEAIDSDSARDIIRRLWFLEISGPGKPILLVINSPGGSIHSGFAIWDQAKMITSPITTLVTGLAASMGSILSLCADPGKRFATPNAKFMIHQPLIQGVVLGQASDLAIQAEEIVKSKNELIRIYCEATGKNEKTIERAIDRDCWLSAKEALEFGLLDKIVSSFKEVAV